MKNWKILPWHLSGYLKAGQILELTMMHHFEPRPRPYDIERRLTPSRGQHHVATLVPPSKHQATTIGTLAAAPLVSKVAMAVAHRRDRQERDDAKCIGCSASPQREGPRSCLRLPYAQRWSHDSCMTLSRPHLSTRGPQNITPIPQGMAPARCHTTALLCSYQATATPLHPHETSIKLGQSLALLQP
jgi:hypothetical protein